MITKAAQQLIARVCNQASTEAEISQAGQALANTISAASGASMNEANNALAMLAGHLSAENPSRAAFLAMICGSLVETFGCDPLILARPLQERLQALLEPCAELAAACVAQTPESQDDKRDPTEDFENARKSLAPTMPRHAAAWDALSAFWPPAIAVYSASAEARAAAKNLRGWADKIARYHQGGHWLALMLSVLDREPIVVIEPQTGLGIQGRISGIADNFELNVLLMDGFPNPGFFARRRVSRAAADISRGIGPQSTSETITGVWNLYSHRAIETGLVLPDKKNGSTDCWVWNEGRPEDIPVFEGRRAILLGPASFPRTWKSQRTFRNLKAALEVERQLSKVEVKGALQRMLLAKGAA